MGFERPITTNTRAPSLYPRNPVTNPLNGLLDTQDDQMPPVFQPQSRPVGYPPAMPPAPPAGPLPESAQQRQSVWNYPSKNRPVTAGLMDENAVVPLPNVPNAPKPNAAAAAQAAAQTQPKGWFELSAEGLANFARSGVPSMGPLDPLQYRGIGPVRSGGGYV